jgi:integrase/recombinase XerD
LVKVGVFGLTGLSGKARQLAATLRQERPDYAYLKEVFRQLRAELGIVVPRAPKRLPYVPTEDEIPRYYDTVWKTRKSGDLVLIKILLYTGVRVSELVNIRLVDVDFDRRQIRIKEGKGGKDRVVPFPSAFKETLALHHVRPTTAPVISPNHRGRTSTATPPTRALPVQSWDSVK